MRSSAQSESETRGSGSGRLWQRACLGYGGWRRLGSRCAESAVMETDGWDESRTVVVSGVPNLLPGHRMRDKLTVHFQSRRRSRGGDVEVVAFPTSMKGVAFVTFDRAADAETVVLKQQHILTDGAFPEEYVLTVFPFTADVFFYVCSANVDLTVFDGDQASLIQSLRAAHRSLRLHSLPRERKATVEGPFSAVRALREDLMSRASQLKPTRPAASVKLREFPPNPRVISHHQFVGPVSRSDSKAEREPEGSSGLSAPLQSPGEGSEVQSQRSNAKTPNSARQKAQSFCDTGTEEELKAGSGLTPTWGHSAERVQAKRTQRYREEADVRLPSDLSDAPQNGSPSQTPVHSATQRHSRTDRVSATKTRTVDTDYEGGARKTDDSPEDTCIWVDSYIFKYMEKFDKQYKSCLRGLGASVEEAEGSDLVRIRLAEKGPSEGPSRVQQAIVNLNALVESWQTALRVYEICYNKKEHSKETVKRICMDVEMKYKHNNVLYMVEESKVKIVGPSSFSYLFYLTVKPALQWGIM